MLVLKIWFTNASPSLLGEGQLIVIAAIRSRFEEERWRSLYR
jgi:hypothetical protein